MNRRFVMVLDLDSQYQLRLLLSAMNILSAPLVHSHLARVAHQSYVWDLVKITRMMVMKSLSQTMETIL